MNYRHAKVIFDMSFGSTGKGLLAGHLAETLQPDTVVTAWAANAGHTFIDAEGNKFVHTMLANGIVSRNIKRVMIGPGSVLDLNNLLSEIIAAVNILGDGHPFMNSEIIIHENAAVIYQRHRDEEAGPMTKIGSTKKGCGAAAIQRIRRNPDDMNTARDWYNKAVSSTGDELPGGALIGMTGIKVVTSSEYRDILMEAENIQIEGAQGFGLSMYHGFYPYTTSRDVTVHQLLADCGIPYGFADIEIIGTTRTYPIRVANRYNDAGEMVGWSGPHYPDQKEISFEELGVATELTTVTKLPRRVFTFSEIQAREAITQNGIESVFLNFANYCKSPDELIGIVKTIEESGARVDYIGFGPTTDDVWSVRSDAQRYQTISDLWETYHA